MYVKVSTVITAVLQMLVNYGKSGGDEVVVPITVFGQENMSVQLSCSLSLNVTPTRVQWFDLVYNTNPDPILIFDSRNNTNRQVSLVSSLTIKSLRHLVDPGLYFCRRYDNSSVAIDTIYDLTVARPPTCDVSNDSTSGPLHVGDVIQLSCWSSYSGSHLPLLDWYRVGTLCRHCVDWYRADTHISSEDRYDIRLARRDIRLNVSHEEDNVTFSCHIKFDDVIETCAVTLHVIYSARDVTLVRLGDATSDVMTSSEVVYAGDILQCTARGNPPPTYSISTDPTLDSNLAVVNASRGHVFVSSSLIGQNLTVHCSSVNVINSTSQYDNISLTFTVLDRRSVVISTTVRSRSVHSNTSNIDRNTGIVVVVIFVVALSLLAIIASVVIVRKHRERMQRKAAAKAEQNRNQQTTNRGNP